MAKTNVKLGGVDYEIMEHTAADQQSFLNQGYLIIGIALNHPFGGPGSAAAAAGAADSSSAIDGMGMGLKRREGVGVPSVLGFAANTDGHSDFAYIGDFLFQVSFVGPRMGVHCSFRPPAFFSTPSARCDLPS